MNLKINVFQDHFPHPPNMIYDHYFSLYFFHESQRYGNPHDYESIMDCHEHFSKEDHLIFGIYAAKTNDLLSFKTIDQKDHHCTPLNQGLAIVSAQTVKHLDYESIYLMLKNELLRWQHYHNNEVFQIIYYEDQEPVNGITLYGQEEVKKHVRQTFSSSIAS